MGNETSRLLPKTLTPTARAKRYPHPVPIIPPIKPSIQLSPKNSPAIFLFVAPRAFFKPISRRRSETTSVIVVPTQTSVRRRTTTVTSRTRACSLPRTVCSDAAICFTVCGWTSGVSAAIRAARASRSSEFATTLTCTMLRRFGFPRKSQRLLIST